MRIDPEARIHRHADYFGTEVIEFGIPKAHTHLTIDVRARVVTTEPPEPPDASWEDARRVEPTRRPPASSCSPATSPRTALLDELLAIARATTPLATVRLLCELIPDRFAYKPGVTYVGTTVEELLEAGAGVCQDFVHLALVLLRRHGHRRALRQRLPVVGAPRTAADSVEVQTHAWLEALLPGTGGRGRAGLGRRRPDQPPAGGGDPRQDRPRPPLRRRPADQGRLPRAAPPRSSTPRCR